MLSQEKSAEISSCGRYRYSLTRRWAEGYLMQWVMLNPSTADHEVDDPTIRRCMAFAKRELYSGILVYNLFALRATDPKSLRGELALDKTNLERLGTLDGDVMCGWGGGISNARENASVAIDVLRQSAARLWCLGRTKDGQPRHPLYVAGTTVFESW